ncbi:MAG: O-methyltransferase [Haloarculaceae archaeon]
MSDLFLGTHVPDETARFARHVGPEPNDVLSEMGAYAERKGFPIVGPAVGAWLSQFALMTGAERVFEFGSGYGYSACWFARALPADGEIVLTEHDEDNLDLAREYLERMGAESLATVEIGDAVEVASRYDGQFDLALLDIEKYQYVDAFEEIRRSIPPGGAVIADNTMSAGRESPDDTVDFGVLLQAIEDRDFDIADADLDDIGQRSTEGVLEYVAHVGDHPDFETTLLPLGDGVTVSVRLR